MWYVKMKLPKHIKEKIKEVVKHERLKKLAMQDITKWNPILEKPVEALREGWDWEMYFFGSPRQVHEKEIEALILTALTGKIHKVDYGKFRTSKSDISLFTITLSELKKMNATEDKDNGN